MIAPQTTARVLTIKTNPRGFQKKPLVVVVGKAVSKKAVVRNRTKRRISSIIRPLLRTLLRDVTVIVRAGAAEADFEALKKEITSKLGQ